MVSILYFKLSKRPARNTLTLPSSVKLYKLTLLKLLNLIYQ